MTPEPNRPEVQIDHLLDDLFELRTAIREMSQKLARIEAIVKRAFPGAVAPREMTAKRDKAAVGDRPTLSEAQALAYFDEVRAIVANSGAESGIRKLDTLSVVDLAFLAKELGVSMGKSKPSRQKLTNEVLGRVRQSLMLRQHTPVSTTRQPG